MKIVGEILVLSLILSAVSCIHPPKDVKSPSISIFQAGDNLAIGFTGEILNKNPNVALVDFTADIAIFNKAEQLLANFSFTLPPILPFQRGVVRKSIEIDKKNNEKKELFFKLMEQEGTQNTAKGNAKTVFLSKKQVFLRNVKFKTMTIEKLLKS